jgi:hypothetical protein
MSLVCPPTPKLPPVILDIPIDELSLDEDSLHPRKVESQEPPLNRKRLLDETSVQPEEMKAQEPSLKRRRVDEKTSTVFGNAHALNIPSQWEPVAIQNL